MVPHLDLGRLFEVIEARLGRLGKPFTTVFAVVVMLAIIVFAGNIVFTNGVVPLYRVGVAVVSGIPITVDSRQLIALAVSLVVPVAGTTALYHLTVGRWFRASVVVARDINAMSRRHLTELQAEVQRHESLMGDIRQRLERFEQSRAQLLEDLIAFQSRHGETRAALGDMTQRLGEMERRLVEAASSATKRRRRPRSRAQSPTRAWTE